MLFTAAICLILSCSKSDGFFEGDDMNVSLKKAKVESKTVTLPFKIDFVGNYMPTTGVDVEMCGEYPMIRVFNEGGGTGTHLGKFTHYFDFCCNNETGEYPAGHMVAYFVAANGDKLFVACAGQVIYGRAPDHPEYVTSYFRDPFVILGGTGRFEGATGSGMTDDYNSSLDPYSHHHWRGTITLVKGKR
jgi:hypothetical protein